MRCLVHFTRPRTRGKPIVACYAPCPELWHRHGTNENRLMRLTESLAPRVLARSWPRRKEVTTSDGPGARAVQRKREPSGHTAPTFGPGRTRAQWAARYAGTSQPKLQPVHCVGPGRARQSGAHSESDGTLRAVDGDGECVPARHGCALRSTVLFLALGVGCS